MDEQNQDVYPTYIPNTIQQNPQRTYTDNLDFIKELLTKNELKTHISDEIKLFFDSFVKSMAISNFSEKEIQLQMLRFDDLKTAFLMRYPPNAYTFEIEEQFTAMRAVLAAELSRGKDGFERKLMATSINQTYMESDFRNSAMGAGNTSGGFFGKIRRMFNRY